jgi:hypothetical protein
VASALDPRVGEPVDETKRQIILGKIEFIYERISGYAHGDEARGNTEDSQSPDRQDTEEVNKDVPYYILL